MAFPSLQAPGPEAGRTFKRTATCVVLGDGKPEREDLDSAGGSNEFMSWLCNFPHGQLPLPESQHPHGQHRNHQAHLGGFRPGFGEFCTALAG